MKKGWPTFLFSKQVVTEKLEMNFQTVFRYWDMTLDILEQIDL